MYIFRAKFQFLETDRKKFAEWLKKIYFPQMFALNVLYTVHAVGDDMRDGRAWRGYEIDFSFLLDKHRTVIEQKSKELVASQSNFKYYGEFFETRSLPVLKEEVSEVVV